jgi:hypothetical protein
MEKSSKKSDVGDVRALMLFVGEDKAINNDLNVKTADYYLLIIDLNNV